jgi:hypothetical protein
MTNQTVSSSLFFFSAANPFLSLLRSPFNRARVESNDVDNAAAADQNPDAPTDTAPDGTGMGPAGTGTGLAVTAPGPAVTGTGAPNAAGIPAPASGASTSGASTSGASTSGASTIGASTSGASTSGVSSAAGGSKAPAIPKGKKKIVKGGVKNPRTAATSAQTADTTAPKKLTGKERWKYPPAPSTRVTLSRRAKDVLVNLDETPV